MTGDKYYKTKYDFINHSASNYKEGLQCKSEKHRPPFIKKWNFKDRYLAKKRNLSCNWMPKQVIWLGVKTSYPVITVAL